MGIVSKCGKVSIERLLSYIPSDDWGYNEKENITMSDIDNAIDNYTEEIGHYDGSSFKSTEWHIRRILYFINHPEEIKDIKIINLYGGECVPTVPIIIDGNHRFIASVWICRCGEEDEIQCEYNGRSDIYDYLTRKTNEKPNPYWIK